MAAAARRIRFINGLLSERIGKIQTQKKTARITRSIFVKSTGAASSAARGATGCRQMTASDTPFSGLFLPYHSAPNNANPALQCGYPKITVLKW
ncbi:MAG: hypothetical protein J5828_05635 [Desulfovibrionaceae bacterium]|nr:hypothetical protein [Desulfovibrionaceae bacterium]